MRSVARFHVVSQQREPEPRITLKRLDTGVSVTFDAASLLAQYETIAGDVLLVLDDDCPYEEQLHLVLVRHNKVIDHLVIGAPYATGVFRELDIDGDTLRFSFSGDDQMVLDVPIDGTAPRSLPAGIRRRGGWFASRHLRLTAKGGSHDQAT